MKPLILCLALLAPLVSQAATNVTCDSEGSGGPLTMTITSPEGLDQPNAKITVHAKGILDTTMVAVVDKVAAVDTTQVSSDVSTLAEGGVINNDSGQATITLNGTLDANGARLSSGGGKIVFVKLPKVKPPLRLMSTYELTNCKGSI